MLQVQEKTPCKKDFSIATKWILQRYDITCIYLHVPYLREGHNFDARDLLNTQIYWLKSYTQLIPLFFVGIMKESCKFVLLMVIYMLAVVKVTLL